LTLRGGTVIKPLFSHRPLITVRLLALAMASISLMLADHRLTQVEMVRAGLSVAVYPVEWLVNLPVTAGDWLTESLASRQTLLEQNASLQAQYLLLKARTQKYLALEAENMRLRELLDSSFRFRVGDRMLIAELLAVASDPFSQQIVVDKGTRHGVFIGQPVLDADGVMGQVVHAGPLSSRVMLVSDPNHALPVQVNRNGLRAIAVGTGSGNLLELIDLPNNADLHPGDLLVTSGLGGRFPAGYPVGTVLSVNAGTGKPFAQVQVEPTAHLDRSREVLLVWPSSPESDRAVAGTPLHTVGADPSR
jgi:rod shape-determining protein MreC